MLNDRRILLIVSGSVAAYKALDLTRLLRKAGATVTAVLTAGGARLPQQAGQVEHLVGGDAARDDQQDAAVVQHGGETTGPPPPFKSLPQTGRSPFTVTRLP